MTADEILKYMLVFFQDIDKRVSELNKEQSIYDTQQDEILHYVENHNLDAIKSCKIIKTLKNVREKRRQIKNELDILRSLKDTFVDKYKNKLIEKDIIQAMKNLKELQKRQETPRYTYQYLTEELEIKNE